MFNLFKIEFYKLRKSKMFYLLIFLTIMQAIVVYSVSADSSSKNLRLMSGKDTLAYMLFIQEQLAINIIAGVFAADYIVTEFTSGYIKNLVSYGHKRTSIFISKSMIYYMGIIIISFIVPVIMTVINTITNGYGEVFTFNSLIFLIKIFLLTIIIKMAIGSISVLSAFVSKNVNVTISVVVAIDFINRIINVMFINKSLTVIKWICNIIVLNQYSIVLQDKAGTSEFLQAGIVSLITILVTTIAGICIFKKSDIK
ncbi:MAG: ABC transporter permease [Clostridium botulinum]|nr:ABC transporter permease [Clostridium botulinum]